MIPELNPFVRGYQGLHVRRLLVVTYDVDCPPAYLPLHVSQEHLRDDQVMRLPCNFGNEFAWITEAKPVPPEVVQQCPHTGNVRAVIYGVVAQQAGGPALVGDTYSEDAAQKVIQRLSFETGHFSRCWEISSAHLPQDALEHLQALAAKHDSSGLLFEVFRLPDSLALGVKLIGTPWTDEHLPGYDGTFVQELRQEQLDAGAPASLVDLLHLAAQADTRFLIFDPDAKALEGLPLYRGASR